MFQKLVIILSLCCLLSFSAFAEDKNAHSIFESGLHSLQFGFTGDFDNLSFASKKLIYKYHFSQASAFRFGLELNNHNFDENIDYRYVYDDTTIVNMNSFDGETNYIQFELLYIQYISHQRIVKGYLGGGFTISKSKDKNYYYAPYYYDPYYQNDNETITEYKSKGLKVVFGAEWFMNDYLSLICEYGLAVEKGDYTYSSSFYNSYRDEFRTQDRDEKSFTTETASFYFSFYF